MHDARGIANRLLDHVESEGGHLTNLGLLKHLYFAHGWHLALKGSPLIKNRFEAWQYGPVIRAVYDAFKVHGERPITSRANMIDLNRNAPVIATVNISPESWSILLDTYYAYRGLSPLILSELTHEPGGPWSQVWDRADRKLVLNMAISDESIRSYFCSSPRLFRRQ